MTNFHPHDEDDASYRGVSAEARLRRLDRIETPVADHGDGTIIDAVVGMDRLRTLVVPIVVGRIGAARMPAADRTFVAEARR